MRSTTQASGQSTRVEFASFWTIYVLTPEYNWPGLWCQGRIRARVNFKIHAGIAIRKHFKFALDFARTPLVRVLGWGRRRFSIQRLEIRNRTAN
jgi:hypothetical protein